MTPMKRLMSDAALERLTANMVEDLFWKGNLNRSDVARWIEQVQADSGRLYEPVYRPRRVRGKLGDSVWLKRRDDLEAERGVGDYSSGHSTKKSSAQLSREIAEVLARNPQHVQGHSTKKQGTKALDPTKAYNAHRLEEEFGGVWHSGADAQGYQDHWMETPDGTVWRPRVPHHYYSQAVGKLMMVASHRVLPKPEARWR